MPERRRCGRDADKPEDCAQLYPGSSQVVGSRPTKVLIFENSPRAPLSVALDQQQGIWESGGNSDPKNFTVFTVTPMHWVWEPIRTKSVRDTGTHP